jgi:pyruvate formate lyase activating enzyme
VLFVSGCPLRCLYCANPDTWHMRDGKELTTDDVMAEIEKYRPFITTAGGGVTLTGGEPLLQPAFTAEILHRCKELGLHTALDTSGFLGARATDALLADTDLVLLDIKSFDVAAYRKLTGGELAPTLNFATRLDQLGIPVWIRYVLVPGRTDDPAAVDGLAAFVAGLTNVDRVDVLPFHKLGAAKYDALGIPFPLRDTPVPEPALTERVREQFREHGLRAL